MVEKNQAREKLRDHIEITPEEIVFEPTKPKKKKGKKKFPVRANEPATISKFKESLKQVYDKSIEKRKIYEDNFCYFLITFSGNLNLPPIQEDVKKLKEIGLKTIEILPKNSIKVAMEKTDFEKVIKKLEEVYKFIDTIAEIKIEEKLGSKIKELIEKLPENEKVRVYIDFSPKLERKKYQELITAIESFLSKKEERVNSTYIDEKYGAMITAELKISSLKTVTEEVDAISRIEKEPEIVVDEVTTNFIQPQLVAIGENYQPSQEERPLVCMIDTGIDKNHPYLKNSIRTTYDFRTRSQSPCLDENGHGTFVGGRIVYNGNEALTNPLTDIIVIKAFGRNGKLLPNLTPRRVIRDSLERFAEECRVFNLSWGSRHDEIGPSELKFFDIMANDKNVLFVTSSGNIEHDYIVTELNGGENYPRYLTKYPVDFPSICYNTLCVGSMSKTNSNLTEKDMISPFTRIGCNDSTERIKPEVLFYGGNLEAKYQNGTVVGLNEVGHGVISCNANDPTRLKKEGVGSSYSAPVISGLASVLFKKYPRSSFNLIKALIINSCSSLINFSNFQKMDGLPLFEYALGSYDWRVVLFSDTYFNLTTSKPNLYHLYRLFVPFYTNKIQITFVFSNPAEATILDTTRYELPINFRLSLHKGGTKATTIKFPFRKNDNIQFHQYTWKRGGQGVMWHLHVTPIRVSPILRFEESLIIRYALVITLISDLKQNLYDKIQSRTVSI